MDFSIADKTRFLTACAAISTLLLASCAAPSPAAGANQSKSLRHQNQPASSSSPTEDPLYLGENWEQNAAGSTPGGGNAKPSRGKDATAPAQSGSVWSLVLGTFSDSGHEDAARQMLMNLPAVAPQVTGARVHTTTKGSLVVYGQYSGRDDPRAKADQDRLKAINYQGRPVFNRVILTRLDLRMQGQLHPHDLLSARRANPTVDPLYTLDVAIWISDAEDPKATRLSYDEVKRRAEAHAAQLRAKGEEAYFYHDDERQWSTVTIGLFDRRAIDPRSGLFSDEVMILVKRYPARLVNGVPLVEPKDPKRPGSGTISQSPKLVLVPTM